MGYNLAKKKCQQVNSFFYLQWYPLVAVLMTRNAAKEMWTHASTTDKTS